MRYLLINVRFKVQILKLKKTRKTDIQNLKRRKKNCSCILNVKSFRTTSLRQISFCANLSWKFKWVSKYNEKYVKYLRYASKSTEIGLEVSTSGVRLNRKLYFKIRSLSFCFLITSKKCLAVKLKAIKLGVLHSLFVSTFKKRACLYLFWRIKIFKMRYWFFFLKRRKVELSYNEDCKEYNW